MIYRKIESTVQICKVMTSTVVNPRHGVISKEKDKKKIEFADEQNLTLHLSRIENFK
jgi:hypothetical protein